MAFVYKAPSDTCGEGNGSAIQYDHNAHWQNFPVLFSIDIIGEYNFPNNTPEQVQNAIMNCFYYVNEIAGFEVFKYTPDINLAKIKYSFAPLEGSVTGRCSYAYSTSTKAMSRATIMLDSTSRSWFINPNNNCGSTGSSFDIQSTTTHEIGHAIGLAHNPGDTLATMYPSGGPGQTIRRTFSKGERDLIVKIYSKYKPTPQPTPITPTQDCTKTIYVSTGQSWTPKFNGGQQITYSSDGTKAISYRWDANNVTAQALEATYYCIWPTGSGRGDLLELKFWGPSHSSNTACCWCMFNIHGSGRTGAGHEGPHPKTTNFSKEGINVGSIKGKLIGIKGVIWPISTGAHLEGYVDVNADGKWQKVVVYEGPCGKEKKSTTPVASQQIQFRVDSIKPDMKCATITAIKPQTTPTDSPRPTKPLEGFVKNDGQGWGANKNPDTWRITNMRDFPHLFKIVDDRGINVATHFTTEARAQEYIDYHKANR